MIDILITVFGSICLGWVLIMLVLAPFIYKEFKENKSGDDV